MGHRRLHRRDGAISGIIIKESWALLNDLLILDRRPHGDHRADPEIDSCSNYDSRARTRSLNCCTSATISWVSIPT